MSAKERVRVKIANNRVWNKQVWELPNHLSLLAAPLPCIWGCGASLSGVIRNNRKFEWFRRIGLTKYKNWGVSIRKSLGVHKILVRKIWFPPPPPRKGPKWEKTVQISMKSSKLTLFWGGGGNAILWTKQFYGHLGVSDQLRTIRANRFARIELRIARATKVLVVLHRKRKRPLNFLEIGFKLPTFLKPRF